MARSMVTGVLRDPVILTKMDGLPTWKVLFPRVHERRSRVCCRRGAQVIVCFIVRRISSWGGAIRPVAE